MRVLLTGSDGFVGRHLRKALGDEHDVTAIDLAHGVDALHWFHRDASRYHLVLHCAAVVGGRRTIDRAPLRLLSADLALDAALFEWAHRTRPRRIVYFSSSAVYPTSLQTGAPARILAEDDVDLDDVATPDASYGWAKLTGEQLARHARSDGLAVTVVRPFSGYGPDQSIDYPFRAFLDRAQRREDPFTVWGDGQQVRDWIHIEDVVTAALTLALSGVNGPVNLGTGRATSFDELAGLFTAEAGYRPTLQHLPNAPTGVAYRVADTSRLTDIYEPLISLEAGVAQALRSLKAA